VSSDLKLNCKLYIYDLNGYDLNKLFGLVHIDSARVTTTRALAMLDPYMLEHYCAPRHMDDDRTYNSYYLFPSNEIKVQFVLSVF